MNEVSGPRFVLDAAAFFQMREHLNDLASQTGRIVSTPHSGEMAKFLGVSRADVEIDPLAAARKASDLGAGVVALKGAVTYIVSPSGEGWLCDHGCIGLATSGSGDTLAGILAGLLARGATLGAAACWSAYCPSSEILRQGAS